MAEKTTLSKQKLHIVKIDIDVPYSQGTKYLDRVQAENLSLSEDNPLFGKPLRMTIFNSDLKTYIRGHESIIADIEETPRPDTEYGPNRTIVQVYDDAGNPVSRKKGGGGGGGRYRSLEEDLALESVKQVGLLITSSAVLAFNEVFNEEQKARWARLYNKYFDVVEKGLNTLLMAKPTQATASNAPEKPQDAKSAAKSHDKGDTNGKEAGDPIKHIGDLLTRAGKLMPPVARDELCAALSINDPQEIKDLKAAWKMAQDVSATKAKVPPRQSDKLL